MRPFIIVFAAFVLAVPAFADYTYTIANGMDFFDLTLTDNQSLLMTGGGGGLLDLEYSSHAVIQGTSPYDQVNYPRGGIEWLGVGAFAYLNFLGGEVYQIGVGDFGTATISGGKINRLATSQTAWKWVYSFDPPRKVPNPHVEVICREYAYNTAAKKLTGLWNTDVDNNGLYDPFNIQLVDYSGYSLTIDNIKFTIIPEPASLFLFGLAGLMCMRKK